MLTATTKDHQRERPLKRPGAREREHRGGGGVTERRGPGFYWCWFGGGILSEALLG